MNTQEFLTELFGSLDESWLEITCIAPPEIKKYPRTVVLWKPMPLEFSDPKFTKLHELNEEGRYGIYFGLASRREKKPGEWRVNKKTGEKRWVATPRGWAHDARYLTALYVDVDAKDYDGDMDKALERVSALNPSIVVKSGGGYHGYWLLDTPIEITDDNRSEVKRTLKGLALAVGGDPHVAELARIFRLPDTINTKPGRNNSLCEVLYFNPRYAPYETLHDRYAPLIETRQVGTNPRSFDNGSTDELERALACIPPDKISYDDWLRTLAGLTHSLGTSTAEALAERWSGWCSESGEISSKVESLEGDTGGALATLGSVFHLAKQFGYEPPKRERGMMTSTNKRLIGETVRAFAK